MSVTHSSNDRERVRMSLDLSPELNNLLDSLAEKTHSSKSDVLRKAIALMDVAVEAKQNGMRLGVAKKDDPVLVREIIGL